MASTDLRLPGVLRPAVGDVRAVSVTGRTVEEALEDLFNKHPALRPLVCDEQGAVRPHVVVIHRGAAIRQLDVTLTDGDDLAVMPAVSGG